MVAKCCNYEMVHNPNKSNKHPRCIQAARCVGSGDATMRVVILVSTAAVVDADVDVPLGPPSLDAPGLPGDVGEAGDVARSAALRFLRGWVQSRLAEVEGTNGEREGIIMMNHDEPFAQHDTIQMNSAQALLLHLQMLHHSFALRRQEVVRCGDTVVLVVLQAIDCIPAAKGPKVMHRNSGRYGHMNIKIM